MLCVRLAMPNEGMDVFAYDWVGKCFASAGYNRAVKCFADADLRRCDSGRERESQVNSNALSSKPYTDAVTAVPATTTLVFDMREVAELVNVSSFRSGCHFISGWTPSNYVLAANVRYACTHFYRSHNMELHT